MHPWLAEFYPVPADTIDNNRAALEHSIQKWTGLLTENLKKHNVKFLHRTVVDKQGDIICEIDISTCALCAIHYEKKSSCDDCPLYQFLGHPCDSYESQFYPSFYDNALSNPAIMIDALQKCLQDDFTL